MTDPPETRSRPPQPSPTAVADLEPVAVANPFPFDAAPPAVCCGAGETLLAFALDAALTRPTGSY